MNDIQRNKLMAAQAMISWARAVFSEKAHHPISPAAEPKARFAALTRVGPMATAYCNCYRGLCESCGLNPWRDEGRALDVFACIAGYIRKTGGNPSVRRCTGPSPLRDAWVDVDPKTMHEKIMRVYEEFREVLKKEEEKKEGMK